MYQQISQRFTIGTQPDGTLLIEVPGSTNGTRRKLDISFGIEHAIRSELERLECETRANDIAAATRSAAEASARHQRIVEYAREKNPSTLQYIEPGAKPRARAFAKLAEKYTEQEIALIRARGELAEYHFQNRLHKKTPARTPLPLSSENLPI